MYATDAPASRTQGKSSTTTLTSPTDALIEKPLAYRPESTELFAGTSEDPRKPRLFLRSSASVSTPRPRSDSMESTASERIIRRHLGDTTTITPRPHSSSTESTAGEKIARHYQEPNTIPTSSTIFLRDRSDSTESTESGRLIKRVLGL
jgi:hypothetical protein